MGDYGVRVSTGSNTMPYVLRQIKTWTKQYRASETELVLSMEYMIENLPKLFPPNAENVTTLVHGKN
jgi:RAB protein geranylgeranyltransferase component A